MCKLAGRRNSCGKGTSMLTTLLVRASEMLTPKRGVGTDGWQSLPRSGPPTRSRVNRNRLARSRWRRPRVRPPKRRSGGLTRTLRTGFAMLSPVAKPDASPAQHAYATQARTLPRHTRRSSPGPPAQALFKTSRGHACSSAVRLTGRTSSSGRRSRPGRRFQKGGAAEVRWWTLGPP